MLLKFIIILLFIAVLLSLSSGLYFLMKDIGDNRKRTLYALGVRIVLASLLVGAITYGYLSGKLRSTAPWDRTLHPERVLPPARTE